MFCLAVVDCGMDSVSLSQVSNCSLSLSLTRIYIGLRTVSLEMWFSTSPTPPFWGRPLDTRLSKSRSTTILGALRYWISTLILCLHWWPIWWSLATGCTPLTPCCGTLKWILASGCWSRSTSWLHCWSLYHCSWRSRWSRQSTMIAFYTDSMQGTWH